MGCQMGKKTEIMINKKDGLQKFPFIECLKIIIKS